MICFKNECHCIVTTVYVGGNRIYVGKMASTMLNTVDMVKK